MQNNFQLYDIFGANFSATTEAAETTKMLKKYLGFENNYEVARLAIGLSLGSDSYPEQITPGATLIIKGDTLFDKENLALWVGLIASNYVHFHPDESKVSLAMIQGAVKAHWHNGAKKLAHLWDSVGNDVHKFWEKLASIAALPDEVDIDPISPTKEVYASSGPIHLVLGKIIERNQEIKQFDHILNGAGYSPHVAIMGQAGSGKTRVMTSIIQQIRHQAQCPVILVDLGKGDLANNDSLIREIGAEIVTVPEMPIPLDMCYVSERVDNAHITAAENFRDAFSQVTSSKLGPNQRDNIMEALLPLFRTNTKITLREIKDTLDSYYEENNISKDSVISTVNNLCLRELFTPQYSPAEFFSKSWLITFANARSEAKAFSICLLLSALDMYMKSLDEAPLDQGGYRPLRLLFAIDEARDLLKMPHDGLGTNIRLHRSKGLSVILVSQSPDDYDGKRDDYLENIGLPVCLKTNASSTKVLKNMLKANVDFASLKPHTCYSVSLADNKPVTIKLEY